MSVGKERLTTTGNNAGAPEPLGTEASRLDAFLSAQDLGPATRSAIWSSAGRILARGPQGNGAEPLRTGLALGYVQSGKTTSIMALTALAADQGYRIIVALLGVTNLLLAQNTARIVEALGIESRADYRWVRLPNPSGTKGGREIRAWLDRDRVVLIPVLKHAGRIRQLADALDRAAIGTLPMLIIDDEADQASLNTRVKQNSESDTYAALSQLRAIAPNHLYVQYTATPYAPLLLAPEDSFRPDFVETLQPGPGYTGGREFFVDQAARVIRPIPTLDEQQPKGLPVHLPSSLLEALGAFVAGAAMLLVDQRVAPPISMLIHSTYKNDVQERYRFLLDRKLRQWRRASLEGGDELPVEIVQGRNRIVESGAPSVDIDAFHDKVAFVLREANLWLVNSISDVHRIDWRVSPIHILIGGNKLDRGFTVEGLTVSYMNRPASGQIDTIEQRARAFGYRNDLLPYCQFFATPRTLDVLRGIVFTEYDLRAQLEDWLASGNSVADWAKHIGLLLPAGTKPTRDSVLNAMTLFNAGADVWHSLRRPDFSDEARRDNAQLVSELGLMEASEVNYGRLSHRTLTVTVEDVQRKLLQPWQLRSYSPGWRHEDILQYLSRIADQDANTPLVLMQQPGGGVRERKWDEQLGFVNLFQGEDLVHRPDVPFYPGDRNIFDFEANPDLVAVQVHRVRPTGGSASQEVLTLAIRLGGKAIVRRGSS